MRLFLLPLVVALLFLGCGNGSKRKVALDKNVVVDLANGTLPFPNDLFYLPAPNEPEDGTLNIPYNPISKKAAILKEVDKLDGFSTTSPLVIPTNVLIEPTSLYGRLHLYRMQTADINQTSPLPLPLKVTKELQYGKDYTFVTQADKIVIVPAKPLASHTHYMVVIQKGVVDMDGEQITPNRTLQLLLGDEKLFDANGSPLVDDIDLDILRKIASLRPYFHQMEKVAHLQSEDILTIFSFTTQTIGSVAKDIVQRGNTHAKLLLQDTGLSAKQILARKGIDTSAWKSDAEVYAGKLTGVPYYLGIPSAKDELAPLTTTFSFANGEPVVKKEIEIPVLAIVPKGCTMPPSGWPVTIFQHGITQNRANLLALAGSIASSCNAAVAIDLPLHGITDPSNPLYMPHLERTFDLDLVTQDDMCNLVSMQPDGKIDCSGTHYINLANPAVSRDNMRQSVADLVALRSALARSTLKFNTSKVTYVGHSLGAMVPYQYLAFKQFPAALLANPGGGIAQLLNNSATFGPIIQNALAQNGIVPDSPAFAQYMLLTQTLLDDADPINYAAMVGKRQKNLVFEVRGDEVIPNAVIGAPLSGTEPLLSQMDAKPVDITKAPGLVPLTTTSSVSRFIIGEHGSLFRPTYPDVTKEMQKQMASFIKSLGKAVYIEDVGLLE